MKNEALTVYFAGELFTLKHLLGNAALALAIQKLSDERYRCVLPQNLEQRETTSLAIRNQDLRRVALCDLGLFNFDAPELDSGTVVEFLVAKFLDIPSVLVRTDFRKAGDGSEPWNLMVSGFPRTKIIMVDSMAHFQKEYRARCDSPDSPQAAQVAVDSGIKAHDNLARSIVSAFDELMRTPAILPPSHRDGVYEWLSLAAGSGFENVLSAAAMRDLVKIKVERGLL